MPVKISVIIPNYNHARFLKQRIVSVLDQTYQNFEIIILDDRSTDNSKEIIEQFRQSEKITHIVYNEKNSGSTFKQWKAGIELAQGDYIWIAESDDYCENTFLETLVSGLETDTALTYCQSAFVDESGKILYKYKAEHTHHHLNGMTFLTTHMLNGNAIFNASMCLWKKTNYKKVTSEYLKYKFCGDWIFWSELALTGNVIISGKILNYYRVNTTGVSHTLSSTPVIIKEEFEALKYICDLCNIDSPHFKSLVKNKLQKFTSHPEIFGVLNEMKALHPGLPLKFSKAYVISQRLRRYLGKLKNYITWKA
ncbi:glycosyltransferase family 2 protein [Mucilaginibacter sp. L196]|uniref:glycosyltransferase family 2 protein n=1 Tax=Mucilaginibacter sp. L196 TaxID=1641870 RepID=UPI00131C1122|nr:glycosyltransferase family 2 protein [Mucilaginibacter sp. L196]